MDFRSGVAMNNSPRPSVCSRAAGSRALWKTPSQESDNFKHPYKVTRDQVGNKAR